MLFRLTCNGFFNIPVLISIMVNINGKNPHKRKLFRISRICKTIMRSRDQKVSVPVMVWSRDQWQHTRIHKTYSSYLCPGRLLAIYITEIFNGSNSLVTSKERSLVGVKLDSKLKAKKLNASFSVRRLPFRFEGKILGN